MSINETNLNSSHYLIMNLTIYLMFYSRNKYFIGPKNVLIEFKFHPYTIYFTNEPYYWTIAYFSCKCFDFCLTLKWKAEINFNGAGRNRKCQHLEWKIKISLIFPCICVRDIRLLCSRSGNFKERSIYRAIFQ